MLFKNSFSDNFFMSTQLIDIQTVMEVELMLSHNFCHQKKNQSTERLANVV